MGFAVDKRIWESSVELVDFKLSRVFLKNESRFPWFILVPRIDNLDTMEQLDEGNGAQLFSEIKKVTGVINEVFSPIKINVASLGNIVNQLHIHVVGRYENDPFWPHSIWQDSYKPMAYDSGILKKTSNNLVAKLIG